MSSVSERNQSYYRNVLLTNISDPPLSLFDFADQGISSEIAKAEKEFWNSMILKVLSKKLSIKLIFYLTSFVQYSVEKSVSCNLDV